MASTTASARSCEDAASRWVYRLPRPLAGGRHQRPEASIDTRDPDAHPRPRSAERDDDVLLVSDDGAPIRSRREPPVGGVLDRAANSAGRLLARPRRPTDRPRALPTEPAPAVELVGRGRYAATDPVRCAAAPGGPAGHTGSTPRSYGFHLDLIPTSPDEFEPASMPGLAPSGGTSGLRSAARPGLQPGHRHPERRAGHVVEPDLVEEVDRVRVAAVLAADAEVQVRAGARALARRPSRTSAPTPSMSSDSNGETAEDALLQVASRRTTPRRRRGRSPRSSGSGRWCRRRRSPPAPAISSAVSAARGSSIIVPTWYGERRRRARPATSLGDLGRRRPGPARAPGRWRPAGS